MSVTFPGESAEYRAARDRLLVQEIELRRAPEAVAAARGELPPGGVVPEDDGFLARILTFAAERGWRRLRLLSSAGNTYNRDWDEQLTYP